MTRNEAYTEAKSLYSIGWRKGDADMVQFYDYENEDFDLLYESLEKIEKEKMAQYWTADSFGDECPLNWEEVCEVANRYIDEHDLDDDELRELWESWCGEDEEVISIIPKAIKGDETR